MGDLGVLRELHDAGRDRDGRSTHRTREALAVPPLVRRRDCVADLRWQRQPLGEPAGELGMLRDHPVDLTVAGDDELQADPEPVQR
jgi:hypothetical protein